jgi:phosphoglucosamine mutase
VISASHNPYDDNGIKFFSGSGAKLPDQIEDAIERELERPLKCMSSARLGKARRIDDAAGRYIEFCKSTFPANLDLRGWRMVIDCAHGAAYHIAPHVFHELGAEVVEVGVTPDGFNINDRVGATHPDVLRNAVRQHQADLGIALDGDADRLVMVDAEGHLYDGDQLLYVIARQQWKKGGMSGGVVGTQMSNLGLEHALAKLNLPFARAKVGDRYVLERLHQLGWQLGGENSGHIICLDKHSTGDGIISALQVLGALREERTTLAKAAAGLALYPQVLVNVRTSRAGRVMRDTGVREAVTVAERSLGASGRVLLRASGTEPVIRVMVEGTRRTSAKRCADVIAAAVRKAEGA